jgi:hypothetical protein
MDIRHESGGGERCPFEFLAIKQKNKKSHNMTSPMKQNHNIKFKRVSLSASVTLEAALVIPLFVFVVTAFAYVLLLLNFQVRVNQALYNTARSIAKYSYAAELGEVTDTVAAGTMVIHEVGAEKIKNIGVVGGVIGFHFLLSDFKDGMVDLVVQYTIKLPFDILGQFYIPCVQRARTRAFIGVDPYEEESEGTVFVYVTPTGTVYHKSIECTYLKLSIREVKAAQVEELRNKSSEKYTACERCVDTGLELQQVYITDYGNRYHFSINCSGIKRGIIRIRMEDAEKYRPCSKCGGKNE